MKRMLSVLLTLVAMSASAQDHRLKAFVGEFEGALEQRDGHKKDSPWTSGPVTLSGRWIVSDHYAELRGTFQLAGLTEPIEMAFLWGWDPFQKEYRLVVLDDLAGLVDVFEQESAAPLTMSNVSHGTYFQDEHGRSFNRVIVHFLDEGAIRMHWSASREGKNWTEFARVTLKPVGSH